MLVEGPVTVLHVVVVHGPLACVVLRRTLPHVGCNLGQRCSRLAVLPLVIPPHLTARLYLIVAVLHRGAGLGAEE